MRGLRLAAAKNLCEQNISVSFGFWNALTIVACALPAIPAVAYAQEAQAPTADSAADQLGQDQRPAPEGDILAVKSLFQLFFGVKTAPGSGPNGSIRTVTTDTFKLRADTRIDLAPDWQLALRGDLPFLNQNPVYDFKTELRIDVKF